MRKNTPVQFRFGSADTDSGDKHVRQGDLVIADNCRMTNKRGRHSKRPGFTSTQTTFSGGTFGTAPTDIIGTPTGGTLIRDNAEQLWAESNGTATFIGNNPRPWPTVIPVTSTELTIVRPKMCDVGSNTWVFTCNNTAASYYLSVMNRDTGNVIVAPRLITAVASVANLCPVYDGTNVWLFYVSDSTVVSAHKFTVSTPTAAPAAYTYLTQSGAYFSNLDARYMSGANSGAGRVYVVYSSGLGSGTRNGGFGYSYLNPATGVATSAAWIATVASAVDPGSSVSILEGQDGSSAYWYFVYSGRPVGSGSPFSTFLYRVDSSSWTNTNSQITTAWPNGPSITISGYDHKFAACGYCQDANTQVVFSQDWSTNSISTAYSRNDTLPIWASTFANGVWNGDSTLVARNSWIASYPWIVGGRWYFLTGYDDGMVPMVENRGAQQCYHLRDSSGQILAQINTGECSGAFHEEIGSAAGNPHMSIPRATLSGNIAMLPIATNNSNGAFSSCSLLKVDHAKKYGPPTLFRNNAIIPSAIPVALSNYGYHELAPMLFPSWVTAEVKGALDPLTATSVAIRYVIVDPDGTQWRGAPVIVVQDMTTGCDVLYPTLRHTLPGTTVKVEIYLANATSTTPKLQVTVANDPTVAQQLYEIPATIVAGESLETIGGALSQSWPVPCQAVTIWRNRIIIANENFIYYSQELQEGFGPLFNYVLSAAWNEATGDNITGLGIVNYDYLAAFCATQIAVISGPGPDGAGRGNYTVQPVATRTGTTSPGSIVQGPDGCYFYDTTAGRLCVLNASLVVRDAEGMSRGFFAAGQEIYGVWWEEQRSLLWFGAGEQNQLVLDYGNRTETCPLGRMYRWLIAGYTGDKPSAATIAAGRVRALDVNGDMYISNLSSSTYAADLIRTVETPILKRLKTAPLQPSDLQGEFDVSRLQVIFTHIQDSSIGIRCYSEYSATPISETATVTATAQQFSTRPAGCARIQAIAVEIYDISHAVGVTGGADFEGVAMEIKTRGRIKMLNSGQVL